MNNNLWFWNTLISKKIIQGVQTLIVKNAGQNFKFISIQLIDVQNSRFGVCPKL